MQASNPSICDELKDYFGTDATKALEHVVAQPTDSIVSLATLWVGTRSAITAKTVRAPQEMPLMRPEVLRRMNGEETATEYWDSYVCDGEFVYNMTSKPFSSPPLSPFQPSFSREPPNSDDSRQRS